MTEQPRPQAATAVPADAQSGENGDAGDTGDTEQTIVIIGPDGQPMGSVPASALNAVPGTRVTGPPTRTRTATARASARSPTWSSSRPR